MDLPKLAIPTSKLTHYLLDLKGRDPSKPKFFLGRGFRLENWPELADALARHAWDNWPGTTKPVSYGIKHVVTGGLECPDGSTPDVLAVWMIEAGTIVASFVTAYPNR